MLAALFLLFSGLLKGVDATIVFSPAPISQDVIKHPTKSFKTEDKIYYLFLSKKKLKDDFIRIQVIKKDEKSEYWGYNITTTIDAYVGKNQQLYSDYFVMHQKGYYIVQVFSFKDLDTPLARGDFWVSEAP